MAVEPSRSTAATPSDRVLLASSGRAAEGAFRQVVQRHSGVVYAVAFRQIGTVTDAEELVQDAFVLLWTKRARLRFVGESALPWLIVTVKHLAANRRRALQRRNRHEAGDAALATAGAVVDAAVDDFVARAFDHLEPLDALVARLCLVEDLSYAEAARRSGLTEAAVRNRLSRTRGRLRRELAEERGSR
ncbi:MAG TPA: RNA polymerase sigma factor [Amnibacterium sp.]|nr:RNA polymerase sigma factor [Amnibacterium sp.]